MSPYVVELIRERWQKLRLFRCRGTVMTDYRILKTLSAFISLWEK